MGRCPGFPVCPAPPVRLGKIGALSPYFQPFSRMIRGFLVGLLHQQRQQATQCLIHRLGIGEIPPQVLININGKIQFDAGPVELAPLPLGEIIFFFHGIQPSY